jgi:predicted GNAT family N-acyltransferase
MTLTVAETRDLEACLALRRVVFIEEQAVPEDLEVDGLDESAVHLLAVLDGRPVGTARLLVERDHAKIGRVAVLREARGQGIGAALMAEAVAALRRRGVREAHLGAQVHALAFYERLGWEAHGPEFDDAGIPHRAMRMAL